MTAAVVLPPDVARAPALAAAGWWAVAQASKASGPGSLELKWRRPVGPCSSEETCVPPAVWQLSWSGRV